MNKMVNELSVKEIKVMAKELKVKNWWLLKKSELIAEINAINEKTEILNETEIIDEIETTVDEQPQPNKFDFDSWIRSEYAKDSENAPKKMKVKKSKDVKLNHIPEKTDFSNTVDNTTGYIELKAIYTEVGMDAKKARRILRKSMFSKTNGQWIFSPSDAESLKQLLMKNL